MTDQNFKEVVQKLKPIELAPLPACPLVSVLMANYNYARYIGEAIESVLAQTYQQFELIVCDDGSTDDSREEIARYIQQDPRVRLITKQNGGIASALNAAYGASQGAIFCLLDADDLFHREKIDKVVSAFRSSGGSGVCLHRILKMYSDGRSVGCPLPVVFTEGWVGPEALRGGGIPGNLPSRTFPEASGMSFRREVMEALFPLPTSLRAMADGYLCYAAQFITAFCTLRETLAQLRIHGQNTNSAGEYNAEIVARNVTGLAQLLDEVRRFLAKEYGDSLAQELQAEDNSMYCSARLVLHILRGASESPDEEATSAKWVARIHPRRQRILARILLFLPPPLSRRALRLWRGLSPSEAAALRVARSLLRI